MTRPIGYYVHHHGDGHRQRAVQIALCAPDRFVLIGTGLKGRTEGLPCIDLPDDRPIGSTVFDGLDAADDRPQALHYAPIDHDGVRQRVAVVADWIATAQPALMVVDVSAEIAMLARLAATPTVYVRLNGRRDDAAHLDAFRGARAILCPFAEALDDAATPAWIRSKTLYSPGLTPRPAVAAIRTTSVLIVVGKGGTAGEGERIARTARAHPTIDWRIAGPTSPVVDPPSNLTVMGWTDHVEQEIASAGVVVGGAGNGLVNAVLAAGRPFVCLPEPRPFGEQDCAARALAAAGAAIVYRGWPQDGQWPDLLTRARSLSFEARRGLSDPDGAVTAANRLIELADSGVVRGSHLSTSTPREMPA